MNQISPKHLRILAIAPSTKGFGFVVLEGESTFVDWGFKNAIGDKNPNSVRKIEKLITDYQPGVLVLQDMRHSRRSPRIQELSQQIITLADKHQTKVKLFSRAKVMQSFFAEGEGTKQALAEILAHQFPAELGGCLPAKRLPWASEDPRLDIFEAVALALMLRRK